MSSTKQSDMKDMFEEYSRTRDVGLRNQIVEHYLYMVDILVRKYVNKGVEYEDLYQVGSMALVFAVERFDASKGYEFTSFATPTIIGEIKRYFRDKGWAMKVPRRLKEISARLPKAKEELTHRLHRAPSVGELARHLGESEEQILEAMESGKSYGTYSLQQTFEEGGDDGEGSVYEKYTGAEDAAFASLENADLIQSVIKELTPQEKEIFRMRFLQNKTQQEIANAFEISQMTVSRIEKRLKDKFRAAYIA